MITIPVNLTKPTQNVEYHDQPLLLFVFNPSHGQSTQIVYQFGVIMSKIDNLYVLWRDEETKCTETWSKKGPDLSHCGDNLTHWVPKSAIHVKVTYLWHLEQNKSAIHVKVTYLWHLEQNNSEIHVKVTYLWHLEQNKSEIHVKVTYLWHLEQNNLPSSTEHWPMNFVLDIDLWWGVDLLYIWRIS